MSRFLNEMEIEVPINSCRVSPIHLTPFTSEERLQQLSKNYAENGSYPFPYAKQDSGGYEIIAGWDVVEMVKAAQSDRIRLLCAEYSDLQAVNLAINEQARVCNTHWLDIALSINNIKKEFRWRDLDLANALELNRSNITKQLQIARKLLPHFVTMARRGLLCFTTCRKIVTLSSTRQREIEDLAKERFLDETKIKLLIGEGKQHKEPIFETLSSNKVKSIHIKQLESQLSEIIGFPITINENQMGGEIDYQFFSRTDMRAVLQRLEEGLSANARVEGKITIRYSSNTEFDSLVGGLIQEENW